MVKQFAIATAMALGLALSSSHASAAGEVSQDTLSQLGLGGMTHVSDAQGQEIRGKGTIIIQANVLIVKAPSINAQANAIKGNATALKVNAKLNLSFGGGRIPVRLNP